jgi:hypothetical protein
MVCSPAPGIRRLSDRTRVLTEPMPLRHAHLVDFDVANLVEAHNADVHQQRRHYGLHHASKRLRRHVRRAVHRHERHGDDTQLRETGQVQQKHDKRGLE